MNNPFKSEKFIPISVGDLEPVAQELKQHFEQRRYAVECAQVAPGTWEVGITRGGAFKAAVGLKSAMKVQIEGVDQGTMVRARVGIFGKQAIPTMITMLVMWQMIFVQAWEMIREAHLDDEAVQVVEVSLTRHHRAAARGEAAGGSRQDDGHLWPDADTAADSWPSGQVCTGCGGRLDESARFCPHCGQNQVA